MSVVQGEHGRDLGEVAEPYSRITCPGEPYCRAKGVPSGRRGREFANQRIIYSTPTSHSPDVRTVSQMCKLYSRKSDEVFFSTAILMPWHPLGTPATATQLAVVISACTPSMPVGSVVGFPRWSGKPFPTKVTGVRLSPGAEQISGHRELWG